MFKNVHEKIITKTEIRLTELTQKTKVNNFCYYACQYSGDEIETQMSI